jgi:hypothetical protein
MTFGGFEVGKTYNRRSDIHERFGGQRQGGICTPKDHPIVILFTGASGREHGYSDSWTAKGAHRSSDYPDSIRIDLCGTRALLVLATVQRVPARARLLRGHSRSLGAQ